MSQQIFTQDLCRSVSFRVAASEDEAGDGFTIDGYAAVFDTPTRIDSWEGQFDEQIAYGAFARSLRAKMPKLQFDHGMHPLIGSLPVGTWTSMTEEKGAGLHAVGRLSDNWLVEPVRQAIADGAVDGMSFRFSVVREKWEDGNGKPVKPEDVGRLLYEPDPERGVLQRTLLELRISEAGPVTWPAYEQTSVGVRNTVTIDLNRLNEPSQRSMLARAVLLADAKNSTTDGPQVTEEPIAEHSSGLDDPRSTDSTPDEHPSAEARRRRDMMRSAARSYRGYVLNIGKD